LHRAAEIFARHERLGSFDRLRGKFTPHLILYCMAFRFGVIEPLDRGLMVRQGIRPIEVLLGLKPKAAYRPLRVLVAAGFLRRIHTQQNQPDQFEILMPPDRRPSPRKGGIK
jgi:hypothetical protein